MLHAVQFIRITLAEKHIAFNKFLSRQYGVVEESNDFNSLWFSLGFIAAVTERWGYAIFITVIWHLGLGPVFTFFFSFQITSQIPFTLSHLLQQPYSFLVCNAQFLQSIKPSPRLYFVSLWNTTSDYASKMGYESIQSV